MTRISSTIILVLFIVVLAFVGVFTFIPEFEYGSYGEFYSPETLIQKSRWFSDSISTTYKVELDKDADIAQVKSIINSRLNKIYGFYGSKIEISDSDIVVTIPQVAQNDAGLTADAIMQVVSARGVIEVVNDTTGTYDASKVVLTDEHFKSTSTRTIVEGENEFFVTVVKLTGAGKTAAAPIMTQSYVTFAIDGTVVGSVQAINENTLYFFSGSEIASSQVAGYIDSDELPAELTLTNTTTHSSIGLLVFAIALAAVVVACAIFFVVRYKTLGIVGILSQLFTLVIATLFAGLVHLELFNIFAIVGLVLGLALQTFFTIFAFEKIRGYEGKTFAAAKYKGFADCNKLNLIVHGIALVVGIILWVIPTIVTAPLGNVLVYLTVLSFVATMGLNRLFATIVAPFIAGKKSPRK